VAEDNLSDGIEPQNADSVEGGMLTLSVRGAGAAYESGLAMRKEAAARTGH
jgi:hypothetical protein